MDNAMSYTMCSSLPTLNQAEPVAVETGGSFMRWSGLSILPSRFIW